MSELPFKPPLRLERCYGELRCRRYLFDRALDQPVRGDDAPGSPPRLPDGRPAPPQ
jgi:hypothetical protein